MIDAMSDVTQLLNAIEANDPGVPVRNGRPGFDEFAICISQLSLLNSLE